MVRSIFYPTHQNAFVWLSTIYLLFLLYIDKATPISILFTYFLETIVIGVFNVLKMLWSILYGKSKSSGYALILFFLIHYGIFVAIQSIFGFAIFGFEGKGIIKNPFDILDNYAAILQLENMQYAVPAIIFTAVAKRTKP